MADTTYRQLRADVQQLARSVATDGETIRRIGQRADQNAQAVARVADGLANLEVDTHTTGEAKDTARVMRGLSQAAIAAASAADNVAGAARAADAQARKSHEGIDEQVGAMTVPMAKAVFYEQE
ncbi:hypothetical protein AVW11_03935 [Streptomyces amritsarensis]|uniref:Uncharacterized protein n=1 Tax=Streptomyces amritsarensis TaxID=681158 RepID=A0ABX3G9E0_9ACTN|nr:hypothetical protein [Streptomyces amritsarensis]OLZ72551.1 hypothetical protein AVW11_03935 [Streptomyces amritsarensis]